eukprot:TRINITY_DN683_c0_g1_i1.p1 TRINITY_DN683_c0_g1~~TRINITY_DN683_c0_g1_i1.p1  ORF type:complete len:167 (-),score=38.88 TRINITY_DN683_c0_g1_i1:249-749(-)
MDVFTSTKPQQRSHSDVQKQGQHHLPDNGGSDHGTRRHQPQGHGTSPLQSHHQGKQSSSEKRVPTGGSSSAPVTPGRSKMRGVGTKPDDTPEGSTTIPKFGDWNEKDPTSADDFTYIFNKRREEKQNGVSMISAVPSTSLSQNTTHRQNLSSRSSMWCCMAPKTSE